MEYEYRSANLSDANSLKQLWSDAFGDCKEYIDRFFEKVYCSNIAFVATYEGKPVSMMFLLPATFTIHAKSYKAFYLYAVATDEKHRGNGVMRRLEEYTCNAAREKQISVIALAPASKLLFKLYEKIGYKTVFHIKSSIIIPKHHANFELLRCTADCFTDMRSKMLNEFAAAFDLDDSIKRYRYELLGDIDLLLYKDEVASGYIVGEKRGKSYKIIETSLDMYSLSKAAYALTQKYYKLNKITAVSKIGRITPYGMMKILDDSINILDIQALNPYMNLMLD